MTPIRADAFVFDAFGTLFDVHSVAALAERCAPGAGAALSRLWRTKQLEYTWLQSLMASPAQRRDDFDVLTRRALDYAVDALALPIDTSTRARLADGYRHLQPHADTVATLQSLGPRPRWILSNGTHAMLASLVRDAGLAPAIDGVLSADDAGIYKPSPRVYELAVARLGLPAPRIAFVSSNCWDAVGAKAFGFTTLWVNRDGAPVDRHGPEPDRIVASLAELVPLCAN